MSRSGAYRGQPLVALLLLLGGWVAIRAITWDAAEPVATVSDAPGLALAPRGDESVAEPAAKERSALADAPSPSGLIAFAVSPAAPRAQVWPAPEPLASLPRAARLAQPPAEPIRISAAHHLLWMAVLARVPLSSALLAGPAPASMPALADRDPRWSADGWLLLRRGGGVATAGGLAPATYGASQFGAVVRYRLAPADARRPTLYLRGSAALNGTREREAALGLSARPLAGVPVILAAEARLNHQPARTRLRPAAFAYTEFAPVRLPFDARAELYAQAGYVGGNFASAFADGQLKLDRRVLAIGRGELRAGGGVWGGAQKGASRLDLGPAATFGMPLGERGGARLGLDWRFRVAGNAAPASGPALTLSAGF